MRQWLCFRLLPLLAVACVAAPAVVAQEPGTPRILTRSLPEGAVGQAYRVRLLSTLNLGAAFEIVPELGFSLPAGLRLDPASGILSGRPVEAADVTFEVIASPGVVGATRYRLVIRATGGVSAAGFEETALAQGRVGTPYVETLSLTGGTGPFTFGATGLPPGITLAGSTGALSGTPRAPGTYYVTFAAHDVGEGNHVAADRVLTVLAPVGDDRWMDRTYFPPVHGEVGVPLADIFAVEGELETQPVFAVRGLAPGLEVGFYLHPRNVGPAGTPSHPGLFHPRHYFTDGLHTFVKDETMLVVPSGSNFHWDPVSLPPALQGVEYARAPALRIAALNGGSVTYTAAGLPPGIAYEPATGELSGVPTAVGEFDAVFSAADATSGEVITRAETFVVLPATGGDIASVPVNLWIDRQRFEPDGEGGETWTGRAYYNADRRPGAGFDASADGLSLALGLAGIEASAGSLEGRKGTWVLPSDSGKRDTLRLSPDKQTVEWSQHARPEFETLPGSHAQALRMGATTLRTEAILDAARRAKGPQGFQRPAFVVAKGALRVGDGDDKAALRMLLADRDLAYREGDTLRVRLLDDAQVLLDRDFSELGRSKTPASPMQRRIKTLRDAQEVDSIRRFSFAAKSGKLTLALDGIELSGIDRDAAHLGLELTIGDRVYTTAVTFFGDEKGSYTTLLR